MHHNLWLPSLKLTLSFTALLLFVSAASIALAEEEGAPGGAQIIDADIITDELPTSVISPDGRWIAYISKGYICISSITKPSPVRLFEVPKSHTHILAEPSYAKFHGDSRAMYLALGSAGMRKISDEVKRRIVDLRWAFDSSGITFGVHSYLENPSKPSSDTWLITTEGKITNLIHTDPESSTVAMCGGALSRDRHFVVSSGHERALIWDVTANKPRATPFLHLVPSTTSARWIGIEKDTRQLVITDDDFQVVKRFDEFRPARSFGFKLDWSPDEQFIIWRNQIGFDHFSNWDGFWMDLESGAKRVLDGRFMGDQFGFTGNGGEFWRFGTISGAVEKNRYDFAVGAYLTIIPGDTSSAPKDVWRFVAEPPSPEPKAFTNLPTHMPLRANRDATLFAIGLPRPAENIPGFVLHLMNRDGTTWPFPGADAKEYISPYRVVGFADNGKCLIAHNKRQLFSIPVAAIKDAAKN